MLPGEGVGQPRARGGVLGLLDGAGVDEPPVLVILGQHGLVPGAQPQRGVAFPFVGESAGLGQLIRRAGADDQFHAAAGADRRHLPVVAGEQPFRPGGGDVGVHRGQRLGVHHRGLIDHHQVPGAQPPRLVIPNRATGRQPVLNR